MSIACMCASEECMVNGCKRIRDMQRKYAGLPVGVPGATFIPRFITGEEVRQIFREEIARALGQQEQPK